LLHVAAEFGNLEAAQLLLERGAEINARAEVGQPGLNGQTPIFHAATQFQDFGLGMVRFLVKHGADLSIRARLPGHYERPEEVVECSPLGYALVFPGQENKTVVFLKDHRAQE
jgi:ankyrin repeat protein